MEIPNGFVLLTNVLLYCNGTDIVLTGMPPPEEAGEGAHNCDAMGCGWEHVIAKGAIEFWDCFEWRMKEIEELEALANLEQS